MFAGAIVLFSTAGTYAYDGLGRLSDWTLTGGIAESYIYDSTSGNLASKAGVSYEYEDAAHAHAATGLGANSYSYDANGNMIQRHVGTQTFDLAYDAENRLVTVYNGQTLVASFVYDGDGRRVKSTIGTASTYFVGSIYEKVVDTIAGTTETKYYYAGGTRVAMSIDGTVKYLLSDHLGSTGVTTDASGAIVSELRYDPWGEVRYSNGTTPTDYTFTGQYSNAGDFGLIFYNARWLDPGISQFTQPDSIVPDLMNPQSLNRYAYVLGNPVRYSDPTGHKEACGVFGASCETGNTLGDSLGKDGQEDSEEDSLRDRYLLGWENFNTAQDIFSSTAPGSGAWMGSGAYMLAWGGAHLGLAAGMVVGACVLAGPGCVAAAEGALGIAGAVSADGNPTNELQAVVNTTPRVAQAMRSIEGWLGGGKLTALRNEAGDFILRNAENTRRFRFDSFNTFPHPSPHMHLEYLGEASTWIKSGPIYPGGPLP